MGAGQHESAHSHTTINTVFNCATSWSHSLSFLPLKEALGRGMANFVERLQEPCKCPLCDFPKVPFPQASGLDNNDHLTPLLEADNQLWESFGEAEKGKPEGTTHTDCYINGWPRFCPSGSSHRSKGILPSLSFTEPGVRVSVSYQQ